MPADPARLDTATRPDELNWAIQLLVRHYPPFAEKIHQALASGEPAPIPEPDEWQFAVGLSRQISNETFAAYDRYRQVVDLLRQWGLGGDGFTVPPSRPAPGR